MNFSESYEYLLGLGNEVLAMKLGLENIRSLLAGLGNPEQKYLKVQIAGTNGKGSTCAFLEAICLSAGINVGLTTSPHLISVTERIRIGGRDISGKDFARLATKIRDVSEDLAAKNILETVPTYFEQVTAIALLAFAEAGVALAILETGLGGRFDATTAAGAELVGLTAIDLDHQQILGESLEEIAAEKAAIIHENTRAVIAPQKKAALEVILARCRQMNVTPIIDDCRVTEENSSVTGLQTRNKFYPKLSIGLAGRHQLENACVAINLAEILTADFNFNISEQDISDGLKKVRHPGRLEWRKIGRVDILFDGAHNPAGAEALRDYLQENGHGREIILVFGAMADKSLTGISKVLFPLAEKLILTEPNNLRAEKLMKLSQYAGPLLDESKILAIPDAAEAFDTALEIAAGFPNRSIICVTGSLYLIGEIQKYLRGFSDGGI